MSHEITTLRTQHKRLRSQEREWLTECRNLNIEIRNSGPKLGLDLTAETAGAIVEKQHRSALGVEAISISGAQRRRGRSGH